MEPLALLVALVSLTLFAQSLFSLYLMLYTWEHPERLEVGRGPRSFLPPQLSFSVLLPARHEQRVIYDTIKRVWAANYPAHLLEIVVICHADDSETIAEAQRAIRDIDSRRVRVETFADPPINKPHGLNVGFRRTGNQVVTIFDAEDDIDPNIFNVVNTVMLVEQTGVVQAGVQLMNFRDHWFGVHNCLEYYFWFKSRLHFHAQVGMIPLGGNTVFIRRDLIERVGGWDERCLTEDADIGLRLSALGEPIRVVYDAHHVTREETPNSVGALIRQRTRWHQGFLQVLGKGAWRGLPRFGQRLLGLYTLSYPLVQALLTLLWPLTILAVLWLKLPVWAALISFLPLYSLGFQFLVTLAGAVKFARDYGFKVPLWLPLAMAISYLPFQWLLGISAIRAVYRELRRQQDWEKTAHLGAHRRPEVFLPAELGRLLDEARDHLGIERGSVLVLQPGENAFAIQASRGLPEEVVQSTKVGVGEGVVGWVAQSKRPAIIDGRSLPADLGRRLTQPALRSSIVLPIQQQGTIIAVVCVASSQPSLGDEAFGWLADRVSALLAALPPAPPSRQTAGASGVELALGD